MRFNWYRLLKISQDYQQRGNQYYLFAPQFHEDYFSDNPIQDLRDEYLPWKVILQHYKIPFEHLAEDVFFFDYANEVFVIHGGTLYDAREWIYDQWNPYQYISYKEYGEQFWDEVGNKFVAYHATSSSNMESIKKNGLVVADETRGLSNGNTGAAIFTSTNVNEIEGYGDLIVEINVSLMKQNGYMPRVSLEEPVEEKIAYEALAHKLGIEEFYYDIEGGISEETIIFYDNIPTKYLKFKNIKDIR